MDLQQNPFHILTASPRDNRRRIMELADERSLLLDSSEVMEARSELTNPRKRLSAEVAWLPGIGPKRAGEVLSLLESSPMDLLAVDKLSSIARSNLLAAGLALLPDHNADDIAEWIIEISWAFEDIDLEELSVIINEERVVSGFPEVSDLSAVEAATQERRRHYRQVIKSALDNLSPKELVRAVTVAVESATNDGEAHGPILIDDLVDSYEVEAQGFLDKEEGNIKALVERLWAAVDAEQSDSTIAPMVNQLIQIVKNWDTVAQPIQVSTMSRGLAHEASHRVAGTVRNLAIHMFNEHGMLDFPQQLTNMLQEVFAEVVAVAERTAEDADTLGEIAEQRVLHSEVSKLEKLTTQPISQGQSHQVSPQPSAPQSTVFALLELTKWPTLPAPWSSVDDGETWIWGDFFLTFQKKPKTVLDLTMEMQRKKSEYQGITYHYAMSVFYRIDRNPHGQSHRPIMTVALEQADMGMLARMLDEEAGDLIEAESSSKMGPLMIGLFAGETHLNLGEYEGDVNPQAVKRRFFEILGKQLGVSGQPKMIGDMAQAHGHPETWLPAKKKNSGCAPVILLCIGIGSLGTWGLTFL